MTEWISVEERLPREDAAPVLVYDGEFVRRGWWRDSLSEYPDGWSDCRGESIWGVTHWVPLPDPPDSEEPTHAN